MLLKKLDPMGSPKFIRKAFAAGDDKRDSGLSTPAGIERFDDILYGNNLSWNRLDVYRRRDLPKDGASNTAKGQLPLQPTIISIHGGGWVYGDKERYQYYCMDLAMRGFTVVNFTYRLAPENRFPAALEDCNSVFQWIAANYEEYRIDPKKLFIVGDSAGAQLASQYCALLTNTEYQKQFFFSFPSEEVNVCAVALNCGIYDGNLFVDQALASSYFPGDPKASLPKVDTLRYITSKFPPAFVMTSAYDFLQEHAKPMADLLQAKGIEAEYHLYGEKGQKHMGHVFHLNIRMNEAIECNDAECAFFRKFI